MSGGGTILVRRVRVAGDLFHGQVPPGAVYVGRAAPGLPASPYANLHRVGRCLRCGLVHDRPGAVAAYARYLADRPDLVAAARRELDGFDVACWCRLDSLCHGDILAGILMSPQDQVNERMLKEILAATLGAGSR